MRNDYPGIFSIGSNQYIHVNHGWWCSECTNQLFELDKKTDHTAQWIEALRQWSVLTILWLWDGLLALASAIITLFIGLAWIIICFFEGVESDTRIYEQQLHEKDGLCRADRDHFNREYNQLLKERHYLIIAIDECKTNLGKEPFVSQEKDYRKPEQDFDQRSIPYSAPNRRIDQTATKLMGYQTRLDTIEAGLAHFEKELKTHQGV